MDAPIELETEPEEHQYLVAAKCESSAGDVTKEYGFVDADSPTAAAAIAGQIWRNYDKIPVGEIYVADFTDSFELSSIDVADGEE
ncbi:hypothetical protein [Halorussus sp. MSC15.2]|uniref:hypothetical protein n=1 Tax=Halorussus sp. MSC15.2 TaxID=2283638 RepID=UPI0013D0AE4E|nr:hypothetical protein [Halorussus sp. MSC15.2]NEU55476.1 hypothetical protein [Halorussus sp. MSC15.2]